MSSQFDGLTVTISGPLDAIARFQPLLEALDGTLSMASAVGNDDGRVGVIRWAGRSAKPKPFGIRGPRRREVR
jgi:hypothetical protein